MPKAKAVKRLSRKNDPTDIHVGTQIRRFRLQKGMSQTELATMLGVSFQQLQKYEKGSNRASASTLQRIANALKMPVADFFDGGPDVSTHKSPADPWAGIVNNRQGYRMLNFFAKCDSKFRELLIGLAEYGAD